MFIVFMLEFIQICGFSLEHANEVPKNDPNVVFAAIEKDSTEFLLAAVHKNPMLLQYATVNPETGYDPKRRQVCSAYSCWDRR